MVDHLNVILLQKLRNKILGINEDIRGFQGNLDECVYLQQIRDALLGVSAPLRGLHGDLDPCVYLQQIRDAFDHITATPYIKGSLTKEEYLRQILNIILMGSVGHTYSGDENANNLLKKILAALNYYFVDFTSGNDSNDGLTQASAWKTITKVNGFAFPAGSHIVFKRGQTWTGIRLVVPADNLYFGCYGSGVNPIIDGNNAVDCITGNAKNYLVFENIEVTRGLDFGFVFSAEHDIQLLNCNAHHCGNDNANFATSFNIYIKGGKYYSAYVRLADNREISGIELMDGCHDAIIDGVECYGNTGLAAPATYGAGITVHSHATTDMPYNVIIKNSYIHDNGVNCLGIHVYNLRLVPYPNRNIMIDSNIISNNVYGGIQINAADPTCPTDNVIVKSNRILWNTNQYGLQILNSSNISVYWNLITNNNNAAIAQNIGLGYVSNINIWNNTLYSLWNNFWFSINIDGTSILNVSIKNNIIGGTIANMENIAVTAGGVPVGLVIDYNLYQYTGAGNRWSWLGAAVNYTNWKTTDAHDAHSPARADPLFTNPAINDFSLQVGSPAINAGVDVGLPFLGVAPDIGAYELA